MSRKRKVNKGRKSRHPRQQHLPKLTLTDQAMTLTDEDIDALDLDEDTKMMVRFLQIQGGGVVGRRGEDQVQAYVRSTLEWFNDRMMQAFQSFKEKYPTCSDEALWTFTVLWVHSLQDDVERSDEEMYALVSGKLGITEEMVDAHLGEVKVAAEAQGEVWE